MVSEVAKRILVAPAMAEQWLTKNNVNRTLIPGHAEALSADMKAGRWTDCIAPICFYEGTEDIADGQHRLWALIDSGTSQLFYIVRDVPREAGLNIDTGKNRKLIHNAQISGNASGLSAQLVSYARGINDGVRASAFRRGRTNAELLEVVNLHRDAADWVVHHAPKGKGLRNAPVCAALGRAWYMEDDKDRLAQFCAVLGQGFSEGVQDSAAVALRNYLMMKLAQRSDVTNQANWRDTFLKAMNAISYFMRRKSLTTIKTIADEAYPLPGSTRKAKTQEGRTAQIKAEKLAKARRAGAL